MIRLFVVVATVVLWAAGPVAAFAPNAFAILAAALGLSGLAVLVRRGGGGWRSVMAAPGLPVLAALVLLMMASSLWALDRAGVWRTLAGLLPPLLAAPFALGALRQLEDRDRRRLGRALAGGFWVALVLVGLTAVTKGFPAETVRMWAGGRERDWDPTSISRGLVMLTLFVWPVAALAWQGRKRWLTVAALAATVAVLVAGHTLSARMAFVVAFAAAAGAAIGGRRMVGGIAAALAVLVVTMPVVLPLIASPADHHDFLYRNSTSALHRLYIWNFTVGKIAERPLLGFGLDGARNLPGAHAPTPVGGHMLSMHPHNGSLQVWVELGLPGALIAAILLLLIARHLRRHGGVFRIGLLVSAFTIANLSFGLWQAWWVGLLALSALAVSITCRKDAPTIGQNRIA